MPETFKKYKKEYLVVELAVFVMGATMFFYNFAGDNKWTSLAGGIAFAVMAIFKAQECFKKTKIKQGVKNNFNR